MKKVICVLLILITAVSLFACKPTSKESSYYNSAKSIALAKSATKINLENGLSLDKILNRGLCSVKTSDNLYGIVKADTGAMVLNAEYSDISMYGDFILAKADTSKEYLYYVFSNEGKELYHTNNTITINDIGGGYFNVITPSESLVISPDGVDILSNSRLSKKCEYSYCDNFILAHETVSGSWYVFNIQTSELVLNFSGQNGAAIQVAYAGGNDFYAIYNYVASANDYQFKLLDGDNYNYFKQTIYKLTVGVSGIHVINSNKFIYKLQNKYSIGVSQEARENYSLKDKYFSMMVYDVQDGVSNGTLKYYITDKSLKVVHTMPDGVNAELSCIDGYCYAGAQSNNLLAFTADLKQVLNLSDGKYQAIKINDGIIVSALTIDSKLKYGAYKVTGELILDFNYSYLSAFIGGYAIGVRDNKCYLISKDGSETYISDNTFPFYWDGFYEVNANHKVGITAYDGTLLIPAVYDGIESVTRYKDIVIVAIKLDNQIDLWALK